ncbi:hypothetical protein [Chelatococcus reniformis]|uniref:DUF1579 domain-containing protein n=1 Tax=Chelatococcus reniformis TaxID=1494448 RepID=A0A916UQ64_9HYPH|nr:hypothetical protein [Chelatococcus reniformis]GGC81305.1 hypothetical protein GCM10010994_44100 [Chelatococcus reniformis]
MQMIKSTPLAAAPAASVPSFVQALAADRPAADRADKLALYSWLVGSWVMDATLHQDDGTVHAGRGEIHAGLVLAGRAIQDVWILPGVFYGTTLRVYDPGIDAWHILWSDPLRQVYTRQIGRADPRGIVQVGTAENGVVLRWSFTDISAASFRWRGERSLDNGVSWMLQLDVRATRTAA